LLLFVVKKILLIAPCLSLVLENGQQQLPERVLALLVLRVAQLAPRVERFVSHGKREGPLT
jgi:hypothetical protein